MRHLINYLIWIAIINFTPTLISLLFKSIKAFIAMDAKYLLITDFIPLYSASERLIFIISLFIIGIAQLAFPYNKKYWWEKIISKNKCS